jgi:SNF2 family DNA or RNA helicase
VSIQATTNGKRIYVRTIPYDEWASHCLSRVPGASFRKSAKDWSFPLDMTTCRLLRKELGQELKITPELAAWAREAIAHEEDMDRIRQGSVQEDFGRVKDLTPELYEAISSRGYQITGASFLLHGGRTILGDQPGLGKTVQTLATLVQKGSRKILVVCPRTAARNVWERETARWAPVIKTYVAQGDRDTRQKVINRFEFSSKRGNGQHMLIINTEMMRMIPEVCPDGPLKKCGKATKRQVSAATRASQEEPHEHFYNVTDWPFLSEAQWDAIVIDESHNALASTSNTNSDNITQVRFGAMHIRYMLKPDGLAIPMSGTPFRSRLNKAWGTLNWLEPKKFSSYWRFAEQHFGVTEGEYSRTVSPEPLDEAAFQKTLSPHYLARTKAEVAPDLPPIFYAGSPPADRPDGLPCEWLDMEPRQARAYEEMRKNAIARIQDGEISAVGVLAELTRLRQFACSFGRMEVEQMRAALPSNKIDWLIEFLLEREGNAGKVVVASSFSQLIALAAAAIEKELRYPVLTLTGATSDRGRTDLVRRFSDPNDPARVAIINSRAGGEAITLDAADDMIFLDLPWTSDEAAQVEARIHRISRIHNVTVYRLMSKGTIDERMAGMTDEQRRILRAAQPASRHLVMETIAWTP